MKKQDKDRELSALVREALRGRQVPILVLDNRWHMLFPQGGKPTDIVELEKKLNSLIKRQGHLVNELKDLRRAKKKLMEGILAGMRGDTDFDNRKKDNQQRLLIETGEKIEDESDELMGIPAQIKEVNEKLLQLSVRYCFDRLGRWDKEIGNLKEDIALLKKELDIRESEKAELEENMDSAYSLMHSLLGHDIMNIFDKGKYQ